MAIAASDVPRQPSVAIRARAASMMRSASLGGVPEFRPCRLLPAALAISARELPRPSGRRSNRPLHQKLKTVTRHEHVERGTGRPAGARDILAQLSRAFLR